MKKLFILTVFYFFLIGQTAFGQQIILEGYAFEDNNRGYLNEVKVEVFDAAGQQLIKSTYTNRDGFFSVALPSGKQYLLKAHKDLFFEYTTPVDANSAESTIYLKLKMERKPGYIFDVTLAEKGAPLATVDAITGARIEVYNNTKQEETLVIDSLPSINFNVTFERGNHYTVLIRKKGYFNKRLEAYVNVEGCILCFEGVGTVTPGVSDVMTEGLQMGSVLANIELEPARLNRTIQVENIYYDLDDYKIRPDAETELNKVVRLMEENPTVIIELGSHTDSRGGTRYNKKLSSQRAEAAVNYIVTKGGISPNRIAAKGYGESELVNNCRDGVDCSEEEHQLNRRTELKIVGFEDNDPLKNRSLADILTEERLLREIENTGQIMIKPGQSTSDNVPSKPQDTASDNLATEISTASFDFQNLQENDALIIQKNKNLVLPKLINNQLNVEVTDMLVNKKIEMQDGMIYQFDSVDKMPLPLLNTFLNKIVLLETDGGWKVFSIKKGNDLPAEVLKVLSNR